VPKTKTIIFNPDGSIKQNALFMIKKPGKPNTLYLKPVQQTSVVSSMTA